MYIFAPSNKVMDTRTAILQKNFQAIYANGFQATRTDKVIGALGITKGAFYHYFPDKCSMGYAVVDEIIYPMFVDNWVKAQQVYPNSIEAITHAIQNIEKTATEENIALGCPLNNLIQEMSTIDEVFRVKLAQVIDTELQCIEQILQQGIDKKEIKVINPNAIACFILAGIEGSFALGKSKKSLPAFRASMQTLIEFLQTLKI